MDQVEVTPKARVAALTMPPSPNCRGIRPRQLARELNIAPSVVYTAIYSGESRHWRFGKAIVIPLDAVDEWLASKAA